MRPASCALMSVLIAFSAGVRASRGNVVVPGTTEPPPPYEPPVIPPYTPDSEIPLGPRNVLLLVNANSPASVEVAKMYREFYPSIKDNQVVYLSGLVDSASLVATPADEIITRADFATYIAEPTRQHLMAYGLVNRTYVIITTAGMPYRIEDTNPAYDSVVDPAASNASLAVDKRGLLNAASVESDLALLFQIDPTLSDGIRAPIANRIVNPYQGYGTSVKRWAEDRDILGQLSDYGWTWAWRISKSPSFEGDFDASGGYTARDRMLNPGSIYLVARLDGPHNMGEYPVFSVREMLERSAAVSNPASFYFVGYSGTTSAVAIDYAPAVWSLQYTATYNVPSSRQFLTFDDDPIPPGAEDFDPPWHAGSHYTDAFRWLTGGVSPDGTNPSAEAISVGLGGTVYYDPTSAVMNQSFIGTDEGIIGLMTFGKNASDGRPKTYLLTSGPGGGALFNCAYGAVFISLESFNALTMFSDASTNQGKIVDFIAIGGTAAIGHSFEPEYYAQVQGDYLMRNLLRDEDGDSVGDMAAVEVAFSALPYLSWTEVFIGDPLMRLHTGEGGVVDLTPRPGDVNDDGIVGYRDIDIVLGAYGTAIGEDDYYVPADLTRDGEIDGADLDEVLDNYGQHYGEGG